MNALFYIDGRERKAHLRRVIVSESRLSLNVQEDAVRDALVYKTLICLKLDNILTDEFQPICPRLHGTGHSKSTRAPQRDQVFGDCTTESTGQLTRREQDPKFPPFQYFINYMCKL